MKFTRVKITNFMRLKAVEFLFDPHEDVTTVKGPNAAGKSAFLRALMCVVGGKKYYPAAPVLSGSQKATIEADIAASAKDLENGVEWEGLAIRRTITQAGGGTLTVTPLDNAKKRYPSPQKILDQIVGPIAYDPTVFARDAKARPQLLADVTGVSFTEIEERRREAYDQRTEVNREVKSIKARLAALEEEIPDDVPEDRVDINDLLEEQAKATAFNAEIDREGKRREDVDSTLEGERDRLEELQAEMELVEEAIDKLIADKGGWGDLQERQDMEAVASKASAIDAANRAYDTAQEKRAEIKTLTQSLQEEEAQSAEHTEAVKACEQEKADAIGNADLGVENLEWREAGVFFQGVPFDQASEAEKTKVSCAIGMAKHPTLPFLLIHDASLLDAKSERVIHEMATEHRCHVIQEVVDRDGAALEIVEGE